jgi:hypothetical protein
MIHFFDLNFLLPSITPSGIPISDEIVVLKNDINNVTPMI